MKRWIVGISCENNNNKVKDYWTFFFCWYKCDAFYIFTVQEKNEWTSVCDITYTKWPISCSSVSLCSKNFPKRNRKCRVEKLLHMNESLKLSLKSWDFLHLKTDILAFSFANIGCIRLNDDPSRGYLDSLFFLPPFLNTQKIHVQDFVESHEMSFQFLRQNILFFLGK